MGLKSPTASIPPFTNRGVQLAEPCFRGAGSSERGAHDSPKIALEGRGWYSIHRFKGSDPLGRARRSRGL